MSGLLFIVSPSYAGDGDGTDGPSEREEYEGYVSTGSGLDGPTQSVPGGGYAWIQAAIGWTPLRTDGVAKTGLSSDVTGSFYVCARVINVFKNGYSKGGTADVCPGYVTGGATVKAVKKVFEIPYGNNWQVDTSHLVWAYPFNWGPTHSLTTNIPWP